MAIKIKNLELIADEYASKQYAYKDLSLDLKVTKIENFGINSPTLGSDIKASFDIAAISNSLFNLFNTLPGQRFLFPKYGLDLRQFLFSPITLSNAELIGRKIFNGIKVYEPRITPIQVKVDADEDNNQYFINIIFEIPLLNVSTETGFVLDIKKQSFNMTPNSNK